MKTIFYFGRWFHAVIAKNRKVRSEFSAINLRRCSAANAARNNASHTPHIIFCNPCHAYHHDVQDLFHH